MKPSGAICMLLALLLLVVSVMAPAPAVTGRLGGARPSLVQKTPAAASDFTYVPVGATCKLTGYSGTGTVAQIPALVNGIPVTAIARGAFSQCVGLTEIVIPESVTEVEANAFDRCDDLLRFTVSESNTAFCAVDGVLYNREKTALYAFPGGRGGTFTVPDGVTKIMPYAFYFCYKLTEINMYNSVLGIGAHAFDFCWGISSLRLSDSLLVLEESALAHCDALEQIHLPASLSTIGTDAVLGRINSRSEREYYFVNGIYCVKGTYCERYIKALGVTPSYEVHTLTDIATGVKLTDTANCLPAGTRLIVRPVEEAVLDTLFPNRKYSYRAAYDISLVKDGTALTPTADLRLQFTDFPMGTVPTTVKYYRLTSAGAVPLYSALTNARPVPSVKRTLGRFAAFSSDDFSLPGDADGDGVVTLFDARLVLCRAAGILTLTSAQLASCNLHTADPRITTEDAVCILKKAAGIR